MSDIIDPRLIGQTVTVTYDRAYREKWADLDSLGQIPVAYPDGFTARLIGVSGATVTLLLPDGSMEKWVGDCITREIRFIDPDSAAKAVSELNQQILDLLTSAMLSAKKTTTYPC